MSQPLEIRCTCRRTPLLGICGRDTKTGLPYVHVKAFKGNRLITEVVVTSGTASIRCRECYRWMKVRIVLQEIDVKQERLPESIPV